MCGLNTFIWHMYTYEVDLHLCMSVPVSMYVTVEVREDLWKSSSTTLYLKFESVRYLTALGSHSLAQV